jgi:hypothetical protein
MYGIVILLLREIRDSSEILHGRMVVCEAAGF